MTFIVAEIGVNWDGDFDVLKNMINSAKRSGCNAIKFQSYSEKMIQDHPLKNRLIKSTISRLNIEQIDSIAKNVGIEWFSTPMYPEAVDLLEPYVKRFKIRESDGRFLLKNETSELLEKILKSEKEVIVSVSKSPRDSIYYNRSNINWLYCVPKYPCNLSDLNFKEISDFDGYSNHCPNLIAPLTAAILGSNIIEVHVTIDKSKEYIDNNVSFDFNELSELVKLIRYSEEIKK